MPPATTADLPARTLAALDLGVVDAAAWPLLLGRLRADGTPRLAVARLTGGAIALGRYQRASSTLSTLGLVKPLTRRLTGGRAIALGEGMLAVAVLMPHRAWLVGERPTELPTSRLVNRAVRGLLGGLGQLGVNANYFGRDFVTANGGQAGFLGFDVDGAGHALVECFLPLTTHWWPDDTWFALPPRTPIRGVPGPSMLPPGLPVATDPWLEAFARAYAERSGVTVLAPGSHAIDLSAAPPPSPVEPPALTQGSGWIETAAGFFEARADVRDDRFSEATLAGELLIDSGAHDALQAALRGLPVTFDALAPVLDGLWSDAGHVAQGIDDLSIFARALLAAGGAPTP